MSEQLIDRIRAELADRQTRETKMFGGLAFMVDEAMAVSVGKDALLVRVDVVPLAHDSPFIISAPMTP